MSKNIHMTETTEQNGQFMVYGYIRVSTKEQSLDAQEDAIIRFCKARGWTIARIFSDKRSGKNIDRAGFQEMMRALDTNPYGVKAVVIHKLDRIGRNLRDLIDIFEQFKKMNISIISITDSIDTTTATGKLAFHVLGALAEFERSLIIERTTAGREYAVEKGTVKFGRKEKHVNMALVKELINRGVPISRIARDMHISRGTLYTRLEEEKSKPIGDIKNGQ